MTPRSLDDIIRAQQRGERLTAEDLAVYGAFVEEQRAAGRGADRRWQAEDNFFEPAWDQRTRALSALVPADARAVVDYGCGAMALKAMLPDGVAYTGVDIAARGPGTLVVDFNAPEPPVLPEGEVAFFSGSLEYVVDLARLLGLVAERHRVVVCSYAPMKRPDSPLAKRRQSGWVNDLTTSAFIAAFEAAGFHAVEMRPHSDQRLFLFRRLG